MDIDQLERDIAPFAHINSQATATGHLSPADEEKLQTLGVAIARKHIDFFATFFSVSLFEIDSNTPQKEEASRGYWFKDIEDAANCFEMTLTQTVDKPRAKAVGLSVLLMFLKKNNQISSITPEEADALVRTAARLAYGYRQELIQEFVQTGQELIRQDSRKRLTKFLVLTAVAALVIWLIAK